MNHTRAFAITVLAAAIGGGTALAAVQGNKAWCSYTVNSDGSKSDARCYFDTHDQCTEHLKTSTETHCITYKDWQANPW